MISVRKFHFDTLKTGSLPRVGPVTDSLARMRGAFSRVRQRAHGVCVCVRRSVCPLTLSRRLRPSVSTRPWRAPPKTRQSCGSLQPFPESPAHPASLLGCTLLMPGEHLPRWAAALLSCGQFSCTGSGTECFVFAGTVPAMMRVGPRTHRAELLEALTCGLLVLLFSVNTCTVSVCGRESTGHTFPACAVPPARRCEWGLRGGPGTNPSCISGDNLDRESQNFGASFGLPG